MAWMTLTLLISALFISFMQIVNTAQSLIIMFVLLFVVAGVPVFETVIVSLTSIYA